MKKNILFLFFFQCCVLISTNAQERFSFKDLLGVAYKNNLSLKEAFFEEELASMQYKRSKNELYPSLNANISNTNSNGRSIDPYSNSYIDTKFKSYSGSIASNAILFNGFSKINSIRMAKTEVDINQVTIEKVKDDIAIELASLYTTILYTEELIKANREQIEISVQQRKSLQLRFGEGLIAESELFKIEAQIASEEVNLTTTENLLKVYYLDLQQLLNLPLKNSISLQPLVSKSPFENVEDVSLLDVEEIYKSNPSFQIAKIQEENSKLNIALNRAAYFPTLSLQLNYGSFYSDSNSDFNFNEQWSNNKNYGFSLSLSIPVFNGFSVRYSVKRAKILHEQNLIRTDIKKNGLIRVLSQANNDVVASYQKLKSAVSALQYAQKTLEADLLKFEYGKISLTELLLTQKDFYNIKAELIKSRYEYYFNQGVIGFYKNNDFNFN